MTISSSSENVIVDHCSVAFGTDETLSMPGDEGIGPHNLTLQWSIVAWGLQRNNHSAGSLFTSNQTTIHHCLWAFNKTRNPRARSELPETRGMGGPLDWVNNVIYGWNAPDPVGESMGWSISHDPFILAGTSNGKHQANAVGNYFIGARSASYAFHNGTSNFSLYVVGQHPRRQRQRHARFVEDRQRHDQGHADAADRAAAGADGRDRCARAPPTIACWTARARRCRCATRPTRCWSRRCARRPAS